MYQILIINHFAYSPTQKSGSRHFLLSKALQKNPKVSCTIISSSFYHKERIELFPHTHRLFITEKIRSIPFVWLKSLPYKNSPFFRLLNQILFAFGLFLFPLFRPSYRPSIVLASSPDLFSALAALILSKYIYKVPFVFEERDLWPDCLPYVSAIKEDSPIYRLLSLVKKFIVSRSSAFMGPLSRYPEYLSIYRSKIDFFYLPNTYNNSSLPLPPIALSNKFNLCYFGTLSEYCNLDIALHALAKARELSHIDITLHVIGSGSRKAFLQQSAVNLQISDSVYFLDSVPRDQLRDLLLASNIHAFISTTKPNPFHNYGVSPNKMWDYLYYGRPTIMAIDGASSVPGLSDVAYIADPSSYTSILEQILILSSLSPNQFSQVCNASHLFALTQANLDLYSHDLISFFESLDK